MADGPLLEAPQEETITGKEDEEEEDDEEEYDEGDEEEPAAHEEAIQSELEALRLHDESPLPAVLAIVEDRLRRDPHFLTRHDRYRGWIPVQHAVSDDYLFPNLEAFTYLVQTCPESVHITTKDGPQALALHLYLQQKVVIIKMEVVRLLVTASPSSLMEATADGSTRQHLAARRSSCNVPESLDMLRFVAKQGPLALRAKDAQGRLPIHGLLFVHEYGADRTTVQVFADGYPPSLLVRDDDRHLPVHLAAQARSKDLLRDWIAGAQWRPRKRCPTAKRCSTWRCRGCRGTLTRSNFWRRRRPNRSG